MYTKSTMFIQYDICTYYASITKITLNKALELARTVVDIEQLDLDIIKNSRTSLLVRNKEIWVRKNNRDHFDVGMGSYQSAQIADLVGLFILHSIAKIEGIDKSNIGLYRDDSLIAVPEASGPKINRISKNLTKILKEIGFKLKVADNIKEVNFLDVTFNLNNNTYHNYSKPNSNTNYVNIHSNHPNSILTQIPLSVNKRLNHNSSNREMFNKHSIPYQTALKKRV